MQNENTHVWSEPCLSSAESSDIISISGCGIAVSGWPGWVSSSSSSATTVGVSENFWDRSSSSSAITVGVSDDWDMVGYFGKSKLGHLVVLVALLCYGGGVLGLAAGSPDLRPA